MPPQFVQDFLKETIPGPFSNHQYCKPGGDPQLVTQLIKLYSPLVEKELTPLNFQVTVGATGGVWTAMQGLVNAGDEVIAFGPSFDIYEGSVSNRGAKFVQVPLILPAGAKSTKQYKVDFDRLKASITPKTKVLMINTPHNPTGKIFSREELLEISKIVLEHKNIIVLCDEVYEWLIHDDNVHVRFCTLPGMWDRTITISSAGKTFSTTGWKIGWIYGPEYLLKPIALAHCYIAFSVATPLQIATAKSLEHAMKTNYFDTLKKEYTKRRDMMLVALEEAGLSPVKPEGTFFICCDISKYNLQPGQGTTKSVTNVNLHVKDWNFCRYLTTEIGVAAIPCSAFLPSNEGNLLDYMVRFAFAKPDEDLNKAKERLMKLKATSSTTTS
eukprot:TRINITY_DN606_c0_g3_i2.p1 TRINITY_DN606_c0_g3~~TRINITY_DN606_c0_g3_i2.p1  ORF type:complete len:384 (+),score=100.35 TRINITY_DN606_c0_g3_i2:501-1652(+)